jgi:molybdopterin-guanine dinucleotide biosynthesis protein B
MPPVVTIVGNSNSGKTKVATSLIATLSGQGYRIAAIKHCPHGHEVDRVNSDTDRLHKAGAVAVVASSPDRLTRFEEVEGDSSLERIVSSMDGSVDMVIAEGFKASAAPKVLVASDHQHPVIEGVVAVVCDAPGTWRLPRYSFEDLDRLAEQLRQQFLGKAVPGLAVSLMVNGRDIPLKSYPSKALAGIIRGFASSLSGVPVQIDEVRVTVRYQPGTYLNE